MTSLFLALVVLAAVVASYQGKSDVLFWLWFIGKAAVYVGLTLFIIPGSPVGFCVATVMP